MHNLNLRSSQFANTATRVLIFLVIFTLLPAPVEGNSGDEQAELPIQIGALEFPPYYVFDDKGGVGGKLMDVLTTVLESLQLPYEVSALPNRRLYINLKNGTSHLFIGAKGVPLLKGKVLYSQTPITDLKLRIYALPYRAPKHSIESLYGESLIAIKGYGYNGHIVDLVDSRHGISLQTANDHEQAFNMLINSRADYLLTYSIPAAEWMERNPNQEIKVYPVLNTSTYFIVSKQYPSASALMENVEQAYLKLQQSGAFPWLNNEHRANTLLNTN